MARFSVTPGLYDKTMKKGQVYKLRPTKTEEAMFRQFAGASRWVYNKALERCREQYRETGKPLDPRRFQGVITKIKKEPDTAWLSSIHSQVLQQPTINLKRAYDNFFEGRAREPRFKKKYRNDAFRYPQGVRIVENRIYLPKIGWVKFFRSRDNIDGTIKSATVKRKASGWYVSIVLETGKVEPRAPVPTRESSVGIDMGLRAFATLSTGDVVDMPRYYVEAQRKRSKAQKALSRKQKGSNNWVKQLKRVQLLEEIVARGRRDFQDKLSTRLVSEYDLICVETLNLSGMKRALKLGKSESDRAIGQFLRMLEYKCAERGVHFWKADRWWPSSKTCSSCGHVNRDLKLKDEVFCCPLCGLVACRDLNASLNLVAAGLAETLNACGEDVRPTATQVDGGLTFVKQEHERYLVPA